MAKLSLPTFSFFFKVQVFNTKNSLKWIISGNWHEIVGLYMHPTLFFCLSSRGFSNVTFLSFSPQFLSRKKIHLLIAQLLIDLVLLILKQERTRKEQGPCRNWPEMSKNWPITDQKLPENDQERAMNRPMPVLGRGFSPKSLNKKCEAKF